MHCVTFHCKLQSYSYSCSKLHILAVQLSSQSITILDHQPVRSKWWFDTSGEFSQILGSKKVTGDLIDWAHLQRPTITSHLKKKKTPTSQRERELIVERRPIPVIALRHGDIECWEQDLKTNK